MTRPHLKLMRENPLGKIHTPELEAKVGRSFADKVGSVELFNLLGWWVPDEQTRQRILVYYPQ